MTVYTLFGQPSSPASVVGDGGQYTMGVQFSVSQVATLTGIWFYSGTGAPELPSIIALYAVSGASLVHSETPSWSGAAGSGWVRAAFSSPPALTASASYKAVVLHTGASNWYSATSHYWDSGAGASGLTSGIITAPNNAGADGGQDTFNVGGSLTYPSGSFNATNYWVDPEVTATVAVVPYAAPPPMPPGRLSPAAWQFRPLLPPPGLVAPSTSVTPVVPSGALASPPMPPGLMSPAAWQFPRYVRLGQAVTVTQAAPTTVGTLTAFTVSLATLTASDVGYTA